MDQARFNSKSLTTFGPGCTANDNINRILELTDQFSTTRLLDDQKLSPLATSLRTTKHTEVLNCSNKLSSRRRITRRSVKPKQSVKKTDSTGSIQSTTSHTCSNTASDDSYSSPEIKSNRRQQLVSKETLRVFLQNHEQTGVHTNLSTATSVNPYKQSWAKKKHYLSFVKRHNVRDVKFDNSGNILLATRSSIQLYDSNGVFQERLYASQIVEPWGLFVNKVNNTLLVSDHDEDCVKEFNSRGEIVQEYGPIPSPCGVTASSSGHVFVCSSTDAAVFVFDRRSNLIKRIGEGVLSRPTHIGLSGRKILVSEECRILSFNLDSSIDFAYGTNDESSHPACFCVDNQTGYTLATNYYHNGVIAIRKDMSRALHIKDANRPSLCAIGPYGTLLVGERENRGITFKLYRLEYN